MGRIGRSYPIIQARALEHGERNSAAAYRRFFGPIAALADPVFVATGRYQLASSLLALLTLLGFAGWLLGLWPSV